MKSLKILLEQKSYVTVESAESDAWSLKRPSDYNSTTHDIITVEGFKMYKPKTSVTPDPVTPDPGTPTPDTEIAKEEAMRNRLLAMFGEFKIFAVDDTEMVKSLRTDETSKNYIVDTAIRKGKVKPADELDDIFVQVLVKYLIDNNKNKKKLPFRIEYPADEYKINVFVNEVKGLAKILFEQNNYVGTKTMYINYAKNGKNFGFTNDKNAASHSYNILTHEQSRNQGDNATAKKTTEVKPEVKPEVQTPPKPAEDELNITPKIEMIQKKMDEEGIESIRQYLNDRQKKEILYYINQNYTDKTPATAGLEDWEWIDLVDKSGDVFKGFETFKLYKIRKLDLDTHIDIARKMDNQEVNKDNCKTYAAYYEEYANGAYDPMPRQELMSYGKYLTKCVAKRFKYMDFGQTNKRLASFQNSAEVDSPQYVINYSARTVGGNDNKF